MGIRCCGSEDTKIIAENPKEPEARRRANALNGDVGYVGHESAGFRP